MPDALPRSRRFRRAVSISRPPIAARNIEKLRALAPKPYAPDRGAILGAVQRFLAQNPKSEIVWIADGLELGGAGAFARALARARRRPDVSVLTDKTSALGLAGVDNLAGALQARVLRADASAPQKGLVRALDAKGLTIGEAPFDFARRARRDGQIRSADRIAQRCRAHRHRRRALGRRGRAARRALEAPARRHRIGRQRRYRAAAAGADLLSDARARAFRRCQGIARQRRAIRSSR